MKITFICAVFPPEPEPAGVMALQLAKCFCADGHDVTMIVPYPNRPYGRLYDGYRRHFNQSSRSPEGFQRIHCANWLIGADRRIMNRLLENLTFGLSATWAAWRQGRPDVMILETWPVCAASLGILLARWWRVPVLYYVQDVYPEALEKAGLIPSGGVVSRLCLKLDRWLCASSAKVIVIAESVRKLLATTRRLPPERFATIPNWVDAQEIITHPIDNAWRREQKIGSEVFVAMFAGSFGHVSGVELLVEVAQKLRSRADVLIVCVGEGIRKSAMLEECQQQQLDNLRILPFQPRERVAEVLGAANAFLLTMQPNSSDASVPSKLISYLAAARPVICSAPSATSGAQVVEQSKAGLVTEPGDAAAIAEAILYLCDHRSEAESKGHNARAYFEKYLTLNQAHQHFSALFQEILSEAKSA